MMGEHLLRCFSLDRHFQDIAGKRDVVGDVPQERLLLRRAEPGNILKAEHGAEGAFSHMRATEQRRIGRGELLALDCHRDDLKTCRCIGPVFVHEEIQLARRSVAKVNLPAVREQNRLKGERFRIDRHHFDAGGFHVALDFPIDAQIVVFASHALFQRFAVGGQLSPEHAGRREDHQEEDRSRSAVHGT